MNKIIVFNRKAKLSEKYFLSEKFILTEDDDQPEAAAQPTDTDVQQTTTRVETSNIQNKLKELLKKIYAFADSCLTTLETLKKNSANTLQKQDLKKAADKINKDMQTNNVSYQAFQEDIAQYLYAVDNIVKSLKINLNDTNYAEFNKLLNFLKEAVTKRIDYKAGTEAATKAAIENLKKEYKNLAAHVNTLFSTDNQNINNVQKTIETANNNIKGIIETIHTNIATTTMPLENVYNTLTKQYEDMIKTVPTKQATQVKVLNEQPLDVIILDSGKSDAVDKLGETQYVGAVDKLSQELSKLPNELQKYKTAAMDKAERNNSQSANWLDKYHKCKTTADFNKFWKSYYTTEWGAYAKDIEKFGQTFTLELEHYGFDSITNPFVAFLKNSLKTNPELFTTIVKTKTYTSLHNAVASKWISAKDLRGIGELAENNLIFDKQLYNQPLSMFNEYLEKQYTVVSKKTQILKKVESHDIVTVVKNLMLEDGNLDLLDTAINIKISDAKLRDITLIRQKLEQLEVNQKAQVTNTEFDVITKAIKNDEALQLISYLFDYYYNDYPELLNKLYTENQDLKTALDKPKEALTWSQKQGFVTKLSLHNSKYSEEQLEKLISALAKKAEIKLNTSEPESAE